MRLLTWLYRRSDDGRQDALLMAAMRDDLEFWEAQAEEWEATAKSRPCAWSTGRATSDGYIPPRCGECIGCVPR